MGDSVTHHCLTRYVDQSRTTTSIQSCAANLHQGDNIQISEEPVGNVVHIFEKVRERMISSTLNIGTGHDALPAQHCSGTADGIVIASDSYLDSCPAYR